MRSDSRAIVEYSLASNAQRIEGTVMSVKEQVNIIKSALEFKWQKSIKDMKNVVMWLAEYSAVLLDRAEVSKDATTAYKHLEGTRGVVLGITFSENILCKNSLGQRGVQALSSWRSKQVFLAFRLARGGYMIDHC